MFVADRSAKYGWPRAAICSRVPYKPRSATAFLPIVRSLVPHACARSAPPSTLACSRGQASATSRPRSPRHRL